MKYIHAVNSSMLIHSLHVSPAYLLLTNIVSKRKKKFKPSKFDDIIGLPNLSLKDEEGPCNKLPH